MPANMSVVCLALLALSTLTDGFGPTGHPAARAGLFRRGSIGARVVKVAAAIETDVVHLDTAVRHCSLYPHKSSF